MNHLVNGILKEIEALTQSDREQLLGVLNAKYARAFIRGESYCV